MGNIRYSDEIERQETLGHPVRGRGFHGKREKPKKPRGVRRKSKRIESEPQLFEMVENGGQLELHLRSSQEMREEAQEFEVPLH
ncbi:MAG: hypothetical protein HY507_01205 [Candidatus Zambryskibacteria bacterium]|nr:hypothetical protein [Candidatus Zambryskibacteria bacterium]